VACKVSLVSVCELRDYGLGEDHGGDGGDGSAGIYLSSRLEAAVCWIVSN
jgi:hypothetical protein